MKRTLFGLALFGVLLAQFSLSRGADREPIIPGETKIGVDLAAPSYTDSWTFRGVVGNRAIVSAVTTAGSLDTRIIAYPPGGGPAEAWSTWYCSYSSCSWTDQLDWQLQHTGLYTIVVEDGSLARSGTYNISLLEIPGPVDSPQDPDGGAIAPGQALSGAINVAADKDAFQFYGSTGNRAIVSAVTTAGSLDTRIIAYPPGGGPAEAWSTWYCSYSSCSWTDQLDWQLQHTGLYTIVVEDGALTRSGTYNISLTKIPSAPSPGIYNPVPQNGARVSTLTGSFSWDAVTGATGYDVYFVAGGYDPPTKIGDNLPTPSLPFPVLQSGTINYWAVVAHTPSGDIAGPVWWFEVPSVETGWIENFESYSPGRFPVGGGWSLLLDGGNQSAQYIDTAQAVSGSKSLHLAASASGFLAAGYKEVGSLSRLELTAHVFVDVIASCGVANSSAGMFLAGLTEVTYTGPTFGAVEFACDGYIYAVKDNLAKVWVPLTPYSAQTWYHVKLSIDLDALSFDVRVNGVLVGSAIPILNVGSPTGVVLSAGATNVWFDDVEVTPVPQQFDYSLANSGDITVTQGASGSGTITATLTAGAPQSVSFSASGLPSGATASFAPNACTPTCSTTLTITTAASTPTGTFPITVIGTPLGRTTTFNLVVTSQCPVTTAVGDAPDRTSTLNVVYGFRDTVLAATPTGQRYINLFYTHSAEAVWLMVRYPALRSSSRLLLERFLPTLQTMVGGRPASLTRTDLKAIDTLLAAFAVRASGAFWADLQAIRQDLRQPAVLREFGITVTGDR